MYDIGVRISTKNIFKDQIILTRMKTVIEKGIENLTSLKDQERIKN